MNSPDRSSDALTKAVTYDELLGTAAQTLRIDQDYWDIWGRHHIPPNTTIEAILGSLGLETGSLEALGRSLEAYQGLRLGGILDPVSVFRTGQPNRRAPFRRPRGTNAKAAIEVAIYQEDGHTHRFELTADTKTLPIPSDLPPGYHDLEVVVREEGRPERRAAQRLIVAPDRAWMPAGLAQGRRMAGVAVSLYGLRSAKNWGAGDFRDLQELVEWVATDLGAAFVGLNPLHALANRQPYNTSPYLPLSSYFRNYLYLDIESVPEFRSSGRAQRMLASAFVQKEIAELRATEFVEYERVARLKTGFLKLLYRDFRRREIAHDTTRAKAFRSWVAGQGQLLERFAVYSALDEVLHKRNREVWIWPNWPAEYQDPESPAVAEFAREFRRTVQFYEYVQWQIDLQLEAVQKRSQELGMPIGLYHDLALATDRCGSDLWAYRKYFVNGCRVGSPPDDFSPDGQDWSFPPPNTDAHRENAYQLFSETIARNSRHGGALRIDHVMRFYRLFWIPDGLTAKDGTYVRDRFEDLLGILALESHRGKFLVVGEDLGTVPPEMREAMERNGIFSYKLFYFEKGPGGELRPPREYAKQALVSSTTHDLPTLAGFWAGRDIESRRKVGLVRDEHAYWQQKNERREEKRRMIEALVSEGLLPQDFPREAADWPELTGELHNAVIGFLVSTPSQLMLLNQEDLTKELDQQNLPGTTAEYPNWRRKMRLTLEELEHAPAAVGFRRMFRNWLDRTERLTDGGAGTVSQT